MLDLHPFSPEPITPGAATGASAVKYRVGLFLLLAGNLLVIVAFFSPWLDIFKLNDPSYPFPKRGYSPWMALLSGQLGALGVVTWLFALLIFGMALSSLTLVFTHVERTRTQAMIIACASVIISLVLMALAVPITIIDLSFFWPFLDSTVVYGIYLAVAGCLSLLIGLAILAPLPPRE